jgi:hypothetical protein
VGLAFGQIIPYFAAVYAFRLYVTTILSSSWLIIFGTVFMDFMIMGIASHFVKTCIGWAGAVRSFVLRSRLHIAGGAMLVAVGLAHHSRIAASLAAMTGVSSSSSWRYIAVAVAVVIPVAVWMLQFTIAVAITLVYVLLGPVLLGEGGRNKKFY